MTSPDLDREKIDKAYRRLDDMMEIMINELNLNYYEVLVVFAMMDGNIKNQNISHYLVENVARFSTLLNEQDKALK